MKREAIGHSKMKRLCRRLDVPTYVAVGLLESLWHVTARETPRGDIGKLSDEAIALAIDYRGDEAKLVEALVDCGWLDRDPVDRLAIHDWHEHADDAVQRRLARAGLRFVGGHVPKLNRLTESERKAALAQYERTADAQTPKVGAQDPGAGALPDPSPDPSPEPSPSPGPEPGPDGYSPASHKKRAKTAETLSDAPLPDADRDELRSTLGLWKLAFPEGPHEIDLQKIQRELAGTPAKAFCAHLDGLKRKFQPGGAEEPTRPGFFESTARNFSKDYRSRNGYGLSPEKFNSMTEALG